MERFLGNFRAIKQSSTQKTKTLSHFQIMEKCFIFKIIKNGDFGVVTLIWSHGWYIIKEGFVLLW